MDERTTGVILRTYPLTETSLIIHWLTPDLGRLSTVAKGARRPKSAFRGKLDLFYECEFSFARNRRSDLHTLREASLRETHAGLRRELLWVEQASYCAALIEQNTESEAPVPVLHRCFCQFLGELSQHPAQALTVFAFEIKLLADLGLAPVLADAALSPGAKAVLEHCTAATWPELFRVKISPAQNGEIRQFLHGFLTYHLERIPRGRAEAISA